MIWWIPVSIRRDITFSGYNILRSYPHRYQNICQARSQVLGSPINCKILITVVLTGWFFMDGLLGNTIRSFSTFNRLGNLQFQFLLLQHFHFLPIGSAKKEMEWRVLAKRIGETGCENLTNNHTAELTSAQQIQPLLSFQQHQSAITIETTGKWF